MPIHRKPIFYPVAGISMLGMLAAATACHARPLLSEIYYDATGPDNGLAFVELAGTPGTVLDGLVLEGVNGKDGAIYATIELAGVIPEDGIYLVGDDRGDGTSSVAYADMVAGVDFQNGPDSVVLRTLDTVLDAIGYGDFTSGVFAGEGRAAFDVLAGQSLARPYPWVDTNDNLADFRVLDAPTPGSADAVLVPLPPALLLLLSGVAGLLGIARRRRL